MAGIMSEVKQPLRRFVDLKGHPAPRLRLVDSKSIAVRTAMGPESGRAWARSYRTRLRISDAAIIATATATATATAFLLSRRVVAPGNLLAGVMHVSVSVAVLIVWMTAIGSFHTRDSRVIGVGLTEYRRVVSATMVGFGFLAIAAVITQVDLLRSHFVVALPLGVTALVLERWLWRKWLVAQAKHGHSLSRVVIVGKRPDVAYLALQLDRTAGAAYSVVGAVIDSSSTASTKLDLPRDLPHDLPISTDLDAVAAVAADLGADAVVIAGPPVDRSDFIRNLAWDLEGTAAELILATGLVNVAGPRIHLRRMEGLPLIHVEIPQFEGGRHVLKRGFDILAAAVGLVLLWPLLAALALIIRSDVSGPALFRQDRVGRDGRVFRMYKFRSMVVSASEDLASLLPSNEAAGPLFKIRDDPRVTRVGKTLRKYSLDELPQLWNVLIGDMSLVGPRPPLPREVEGYESYHCRRLYIRPGLTGMWQVNGRSTLSWEESVQYDLYYVENWSLIGDIAIIWRTARQLIAPVGAW